MKIPLVLPCSLAAALLGSGCMSFKVGPPEIRRAEYRADTVFVRTLSREAVDVAPAVSQEGDALRVGLRGAIETKDEMADVYREVRVKRQKRLSFGLFPGFAEMWLVPRNGLGPLFSMRIETDPKRIEHERRLRYGLHPVSMGEVYDAPTGEVYIPLPVADGLLDLTAPVTGILYTPWATLVTPFYGDWDCSSHHWCQLAGRKDMRVLALVPPEERRKLGVNTGPSHRDGGFIAHFAWFGFHRYLDLFVEGPVQSRKESVVRTTKSDPISVAGPFEIEVEIPEIGYRRRQGVLEGRTEETFFLPSAARPLDAAAKIRFFRPEPDDDADPDRAAVLDAAIGRTFSETATIRNGQ